MIDGRAGCFGGKGMQIGIFRSFWEGRIRKGGLEIEVLKERKRSSERFERILHILIKRKMTQGFISWDAAIE